MKRAFMAFGGSARVCLGQNLARMELLHAVARFFRACPTARIADSMKDKDATMVDFFVIKPACGAMEITLDQEQ
ncbi:hypothetical protein PV05_04368 [Exophiala xenobiotica]|uniref:Uncharacterized protein n=1 Tax=Exophiala xenobiotica TaxID=348802 RepID=A0A0D2CZR0_9EURO|nr:uncharacterized protein PV05_04368 [Exophiala xenobiotica]KIW55637.1 hypothetical protein PV05_04368 [Exophiala xenobiotica]